MSLADSLSAPRPRKIRCVFGELLDVIDDTDAEEVADALHDPRVSDPRLQRYIADRDGWPDAPSTSAMSDHRLGYCCCPDDS